MTKIQRLASVGMLAALGLTVAACGSSATSSAPSSEASAPSAASSAPASSAAASSNGVTTPADTFGPACSKLPQGDTPGSLNAMGPEPVATAASTNPVLTKLVAAVKAVPGLADTLNSTDKITVFAPADDAFAALGDATFKQLAAAPDKLGPILQHHVVAMRYDAKGLIAAGSVKPLAGGDIQIQGSGDSMTIGGAHVLCGNIPTKNATVFVIDKVLQ